MIGPRVKTLTLDLNGEKLTSCNFYSPKYYPNTLIFIILEQNFNCITYINSHSIGCVYSVRVKHPAVYCMEIFD